ncbi:unnamed protein product [Polarella glacialis]|uniref:Uncharacterized protein n=1 Tax=Polarella glacialis TaxID=89957 RepID=A0A813HYE8_POLGL|nr:unnamed protein product [Polarella glacialis]
MGDAGYRSNLSGLMARLEVAPAPALGGLASFLSDVMRPPASGTDVPMEAPKELSPEALQQLEFSEMLEELKQQGLSEEHAREMLVHMQSAEPVSDEEDDDSEDEVDETLLSSTRAWMALHPPAPANEEFFRDFNLKIRLQGHVESTPPDHLRAMLQVITLQAFEDPDILSATQPAAVAEKLKPVLDKWAYMLGNLYSKCDALCAADIVVGSVGDCEAEAHPIAFVGVLMSVRAGVAALADDKLLLGCRRLPAGRRQSTVMAGFISFLEQAGDSSDEG